MRHRDFDYSQAGGYFITLVTDKRKSLFGTISQGRFMHSSIGNIAQKCWDEIPRHFPQVVLDEFVMMPDHLHGILFVYPDLPAFQMNESGDACVAATVQKTDRPALSLSSIIGSYKSAVTRIVHLECPESPRKIWQRNYYDRIIRNDNELDMTRLYIKSNPDR